MDSSNNVEQQVVLYVKYVLCWIPIYLGGRFSKGPFLLKKIIKERDPSCCILGVISNIQAVWGILQGHSGNVDMQCLVRM